MTLKEKSISGFVWSFVDNIGNHGVQFVIGIILARILTPEDYGLVGMITVFVAVSQSFIDAGFTQALIRKNDAKQKDYSTIFYFNIVVGFFIYILLFLVSPLISSFFNEPQLTDLVKVLGITVIINAIAIVQRARLTKDINFKLQSKISISSNISSGAIGIGLALAGYGVWSLVWRSLLNNFFQTVLLWIFNKWKPTWEFSKSSFKELFNFGYKLLLSGLLDRVYKNIYYLVIGKYFSAADLGFYTRADQFKNLFASNLNSTIQRVSFPVLAKIQDNNERLKAAYKKLLKITVFLSGFLMLSLAGVAETLILVLLGEKWAGSIEYLQLLCLVGVFYPLHALNLNILNVKGRSDLFLKLDFIKKSIAIPIIMIGIYFGIKAMIIAMIGNSIISYFLNSQYSGKLISYPSIEQLRDVTFSFLLSFSIGFILFLFPYMLLLTPIVILPIQIITAIVLLLIIGESFNLYEYIELKNIIYEKFKIRK